MVNVVPSAISDLMGDITFRVTMRSLASLPDMIVYVHWESNCSHTLCPFWRKQSYPQNACDRQLFAAAVSINGQRVWGQFDSQCTYTVMSGKLASNLNVTLKVISPIRSEMADGTILTIDTSTEEVLIQVDRQEPFTTTIFRCDQCNASWITTRKTL